MFLLLAPVVGAIVGYFLALAVAHLLGVAYREVAVGRVGDAPIYENRHSFVCQFLATVGTFGGFLAGFVAWGVVPQL